MQTTVQLVNYAAHREILHRIRHAVFVQEQGVPAAIEVDRWDPLCIHALAQYHDQPVGTGRLLPDGYIGRVAVLPDMRQQGVGTQLMQQLLQAARAQGHLQVKLSAQCHAVAFYRQLGFWEEGAVYQEAGIDHIKMVKTLGVDSSWNPKPGRVGALAIGAARL